MAAGPDRAGLAHVHGQPANRPSFSPSVDGTVHRGASCVAFLSAASNLVRRDRNGKVDAFLSRRPGGAPSLASILPNGRQTKAGATAVAVWGDCSRVAFVAGGHLYVRHRRRTVAIKSNGPVTNPSFASGLGNDLVVAARGGVYLSRNGTGRPRLIAAGGFNPTFNGFGRREIAYEKVVRGRVQVVFRELGHTAELASATTARRATATREIRW